MNYMNDLFFPQIDNSEEFDGDEDVSIEELKSLFEQLGIQTQKSQWLARYIVEPQSGAEIVLNEALTCTKDQALAQLAELIGPYEIYEQVNDPSMTKLFFGTYAEHRGTLYNALKLADYEESGVVDCDEIRDAI